MRETIIDCKYIILLTIIHINYRVHLYVGFEFLVVRLGKILAGTFEFELPADGIADSAALALPVDGLTDLAGTFEFDPPVDDATGGTTLLFGPPS